MNTSSRIDPFPGAAAAAHLYRSHAWRALGQLRAGTAIDPLLKASITIRSSEPAAAVRSAMRPSPCR